MESILSQSRIKSNSSPIDEKEKSWSSMIFSFDLINFLYESETSISFISKNIITWNLGSMSSTFELSCYLEICNYFFNKKFWEIQCSSSLKLGRNFQMIVILDLIHKNFEFLKASAFKIGTITCNKYWHFT